MKFIPVGNQNKAIYGISTGLKYACHVPMACGTTSHFAKNVHYDFDESTPNPQVSVEIATAEDLDDTNSYRSGVSSLRSRFRREHAGWNSSPDLPSKLQHGTNSEILSCPQSPAPGLTKRWPASSHSSEFQVTNLRHCWTEPKIRQMSIARLEWYGSKDDADHFLLMQLVSAPTTQEKDTWMRLERRAKYSSMKLLAGQAMSLVGRPMSDDVVNLSCNKNDLINNGSTPFRLKETIEEPIPFSFVLDVLDIAHKSLAPNVNDGWLYASFIMEAIHRFCEPISPLSDTSSVQSNNPHRILKNLSDSSITGGLKHEITLQHDWELL